jgi:hypothetical protein
MTLQVMLTAGNRRAFFAELGTRFGQKLHHNFGATFPDIGWLVLLAGLIYLYAAIAPLHWEKQRQPLADSLNQFTPAPGTD